MPRLPHNPANIYIGAFYDTGQSERHWVTRPEALRQADGLEAGFCKDYPGHPFEDCAVEVAAELRRYASLLDSDERPTTQPDFAITLADLLSALPMR